MKPTQAYYLQVANEACNANRDAANPNIGMVGSDYKEFLSIETKSVLTQQLPISIYPSPQFQKLQLEVIPLLELFSQIKPHQAFMDRQCKSLNKEI